MNRKFTFDDSPPKPAPVKAKAVVAAVLERPKAKVIDLALAVEVSLEMSADQRSQTFCATFLGQSMFFEAGDVVHLVGRGADCSAAITNTIRCQEPYAGWVCHVKGVILPEL